MPLFVLATARAGSHHLTGLLRDLPGVSVRGEILNPKYIPRWLQPAVRNQSMRFTSRPRALAYVARVLAEMPGPVCVVRLLPSHLARAGISAQDLHEAFPDALFPEKYGIESMWTALTATPRLSRKSHPVTLGKARMPLRSSAAPPQSRITQSAIVRSEPSTT